MPKREKSLKELRMAVERGRAKIKENEERAKLRRELLAQRNPKLVATGRALKTGAVVTGRGLVSGAKSLQKFAVAREDRLRKESKRKKKRSKDFSEDFNFGF